MYKHFNPEKHKVETKIATVKKGFQCKYNINYHIIWIPEYRKHMLKGKVIEVLQSILKGQCEELNIQFLMLQKKLNVRLEILQDDYCNMWCTTFSNQNKKTIKRTY